jgi:hypothetical protein
MFCTYTVDVGPGNIASVHFGSTILRSIDSGMAVGPCNLSRSLYITGPCLRHFAADCGVDSHPTCVRLSLDAVSVYDGSTGLAPVLLSNGNGLLVRTHCARGKLNLGPRPPPYPTPTVRSALAPCVRSLFFHLTNARPPVGASVLDWAWSVPVHHISDGRRRSLVILQPPDDLPGRRSE